MLDQNGTIFKFAFSVVLFSPIDGPDNREIERYRIHYTQAMHRFLLFNADEDDVLAANNYEIIKELIAKLFSNT